MEQGNPQHAFDMTDKFLRSANSLFERIDDSSGTVADVYRELVELWISAAEKLRSSDGMLIEGAVIDATSIDWMAKILSYFNDNDYGIYDGLLPLCGSLLSKDELRKLAWRFENQARKALKENTGNGYDFEANHACIGLRSVAEALQDVELYERATLITSPNPNELQKEQLAAYCLEQKLPERTLNWLQGEWEPCFSGKQTRLLEACHQQLGNSDAVLLLRQREYAQRPDLHSLEALLEILDPKEQGVQKQKAREQAPDLPLLDQAIPILFKLEEIALAADTLRKRHAELPQVFYPSLIDWAKQFERAEPLAAVLCYRALLNDILNEGRSKAYGYAVNYFNKLSFLDAGISDYQNSPNARQYIAELQQQHWRKRRFWELVDHPNKAEN